MNPMLAMFAKMLGLDENTLVQFQTLINGYHESQQRLEQSAMRQERLLHEINNRLCDLAGAERPQAYLPNPRDNHAQPGSGD